LLGGLLAFLMTTNMLMKLVIILRAGQKKLALFCALLFMLVLAGGISILWFNPPYLADKLA
jgi:hypothetical protein